MSKDGVCIPNNQRAAYTAPFEWRSVFLYKVSRPPYYLSVLTENISIRCSRAYEATWNIGVTNIGDSYVYGQPTKYNLYCVDSLS